MIGYRKNNKDKLIQKINRLNKKYHRAILNNETSKAWWRSMKIKKLKERLKQEFGEEI
ncbi:MAG: Uncharacterised protein [Bacteroidetes bacterium MED-G17]|nr:MAG: Uncharacterised protein [Bacteroidetes bacterium MED-G17]|tara:strand:- start:78 stop:251 length:174 start_codon:yes stop_codon:yes gene_type:complete